MPRRIFEVIRTEGQNFTLSVEDDDGKMIEIQNTVLSGPPPAVGTKFDWEFEWYRHPAAN